MQVSRRSFLAAGAVGLGTVAGWSVLGHQTAQARGPAARTTRLNTDWRFGGRYVEGSTAAGFDDSAFAAVTLPHCVTRLSWHDWDPASWQDVWIYRRHFDRPAGTDGARLFLDFDGSMTGTTVTVNDHEFAPHLGGYLPFSYEITDRVRPTGNVVAAVVDGRWLNVPPDGNPKGSVSVDYLEPAGIYRDVYLRAVPPTFVADVFAKPVDVLTDDRRVDVECTVDSAAVPTGTAVVVVELRWRGRRVATTTLPLSITAAGPTTVTGTLRHLGDVALWDVDAPNLYDVVATLVVAGRPVHDHTVRIGFREARFEVDGFFLNGRRHKIFGLDRHQIYPYVGMAMPARVQRRDAEMLKRDLNCTMVRCSHYPQSPAFLDACDELGLMAWEELPGWQYIGDAAWQDLAVDAVRDMIRRDRNRPSIVVWGSRVNESANNPALYARTNAVVRELDGSRPTSGAMDIYSTTDWDQDVFAYDDYLTDGDNAFLRPPLPDVPYFLSEAVGALDGNYHFYRWFDSNAALAAQGFFHAQVHNTAASDDRYGGLIGWCAFDYDSQNGFTYKVMKTPGVADTFRVLKPGATFYQSQVDPRVRPVILPAFFWDYGPKSPAGGPGPGSMICSNCDRLELYVDNRHHATVTPDVDRFPYLTHPPSFVDINVDGGGRHRPELRIDGYVGTRFVASRRMSSDPRTDRLQLLADDRVLDADGSDATRVVFRGLDRYGNQRPYVTGDVRLSLVGAGVLVGDNPFPTDDTPGVGAVWVRTIAGRRGPIRLAASHPVFGSAATWIEAR